MIDKISKRIKGELLKALFFIWAKKNKLWHYYIFLAIYCNKKLYLDRYKIMSKKLRFFSDLLARAVNEIEYKNVVKKLKKNDLIADVDDQRSHHFCS